MHPSMDLFYDNNDSHNSKPEDKLDVYKLEFAKFTQSNFLWVNKISYYYFESIYNFIQSGYLDSEKLISEATLLFEEHEKSKTSEDQTLIENIGGFPHLSNEDFKLKLHTIFEKMNNGSFVFGYFLRACEVLYIVQEDALIEMSKEELNTFFEKSFSIIEKTTHELLPNQDYIREHMERLKKYNPDFSKRTWKFFCKVYRICAKKELTHKLENITDFKFNFIPVIKNLEINYVANKIIEKIKNRNEISEILSQIERDAFLLNLEDLERVTLFRNALLEIGNQLKLESIDKYILNELLKPLNEFIGKYPSV